MANEPYLLESVGRWAQEDAYDDGPTVPAANVLYLPRTVDTPVNSYVPNITGRTAHSAYPSGVRPSFNGAGGVVSPGALPLSHLDVGSVVLTPTGSVANVPPQYPWWLMMGFTASYANGADYSGLLPSGVSAQAGNNDEILSFTWDPYHSRARSSVRLQVNYIAEGRTEGLLHDCRGCRSDGVIRLNNGAPWTIEPSGGLCLAYQPTKASSPTLNSSFIAEEPLVGRGGNYALTEVETPNTYGGGTETSPSIAAIISNKVISLNCPVFPKASSHKDYGVASIRWNVSTAVPTMTMDLDAITWPDDWNVYTMIETRKMLRYTEVIRKPESSVSFARVRFTGFITGFEPAVENNYRQGRLTLSYAFPESGGDGGGLVPATGGLVFEHVTIVAV